MKEEKIEIYIKFENYPSDNIVATIDPKKQGLIIKDNGTVAITGIHWEEERKGNSWLFLNEKKFKPKLSIESK